MPLARFHCKIRDNNLLCHLKAFSTNALVSAHKSVHALSQDTQAP